MVICSFSGILCHAQQKSDDTDQKGGEPCDGALFDDDNDCRSAPSPPTERIEAVFPISSSFSVMMFSFVCSV